MGQAYGTIVKIISRLDTKKSENVEIEKLLGTNVWMDLEYKLGELFSKYGVCETIMRSLPWANVSCSGIKEADKVLLRF